MPAVGGGVRGRERGGVVLSGCPGADGALVRAIARNARVHRIGHWALMRFPEPDDPPQPIEPMWTRLSRVAGSCAIGSGIADVSEVENPRVNNRAASNTAPLIILLTGFVLVAGCSNPKEDVRLTLCKDLATTQIGSPQSIVWKATGNDIRGYEHLAVNLEFEVRDASGTTTPMKASCFYNYTAVEHTADILSNPLNAYAASPFKMTLNGAPLSGPVLAAAIKTAMVNQGKALVDRVQKGIEDAVRRIQDRPQ